MEYVEYVNPEKKQAIRDLLNRLTEHNLKPHVSDYDYSRKLDWLFIQGYIWNSVEKRFIYRPSDTTPNPLGSNDVTNK